MPEKTPEKPSENFNKYGLFFTAKAVIFKVVFSIRDFSFFDVIYGICTAEFAGGKYE